MIATAWIAVVVLLLLLMMMSLMPTAALQSESMRGESSKCSVSGVSVQQTTCNIDMCRASCGDHV